jgi:hypothetical protein
MIVQILGDIFAGDNKRDLRRLDKLWDVIEDQHTLFLKEDEDIEALMESCWFAGLRDSIKTEIYGFIVKLLQSDNKTKPRVKVSNINPEDYSIEEAIRFLGQPFSLVLENSYNDAFFFNALLGNFKKKGKQIVTAKANGWFVFGMGGGSTIPDMLQSKMDEFKGVAFTKDSKKYLRCFVLIDSDRHFPTDEIQHRLVNFLEENEIPYHFLEKREMENYLPDEVFSEITDNRAFVDAYLKLEAIQKDYFDLEKGFDNNKFDRLPIEVQSLFELVGEKEKEIFRSKNLKKINGSPKENFKSDFPKLFLSPKVTHDNLLARCSHHSNDPNVHPYNPNELPDLLTEITSLL